MSPVGFFLRKDLYSLNDMLRIKEETKQTKKQTKNLNESCCAMQNIQNTENTAAQNFKISFQPHVKKS